MVVKRFFISISMLFFGALLLQAKNEVIDHGQFCAHIIIVIRKIR